MRKQQFVAVAFALLVLLSYTGETAEDQDAAVALLVYLPFPFDTPTTPTTMKGANTWQENELLRPRASNPGRT